MQTTELSTQNLAALYELRAQEKAIKAKIDAIIDPATDEAVAYLAKDGEVRGEFTVPGVGTFQLQRTDVYDFSDYKKYKSDEAVKWRADAKDKLRYQNKVKSCTASMDGHIKTFLKLNPDKQPDEIKLTVKVIDKK